jgi:hypothetical protein
MATHKIHYASRHRSLTLYHWIPWLGRGLSNQWSYFSGIQGQTVKEIWSGIQTFGEIWCQEVTLIPLHNPSCSYSVEDWFKDEKTTKTLWEEYGIDYASGVGALLDLSYTRPDITYAVVMFVKYTWHWHQGVVHREDVLHLLRCLKDSIYLGLK